jgi:squalene-hopene/tetraprenyl-beta-curcumene cyclase
VLARAALGMGSEADRVLTAGFLGSFEHFTSARKKALLGSIFAVCGVIPDSVG